MHDGKNNDDRNDCARTPERNDKTKQKKQIVNPVENVPKAEFDKTSYSLKPTQIQSHQTNDTFELINPINSTEQQKMK